METFLRSIAEIMGNGVHPHGNVAVRFGDVALQDSMVMSNVDKRDSIPW